MPDRRDWPHRPSETEWLSITRYADRFGISRPTVYKWLREGYLITYQRGRVIRIKPQPPTSESATSPKSHPDCKAL